MRKLVITTLAALAIAGSAVVGTGSAEAAGAAPKPPKQSWTFTGMFGYFDQGQLRRGWQIYKDVCSGCHGLSYVYYRNLSALGFSEDEIKDIAAMYEVPDGPNEYGETIVDGDRLMRPAEPADRVKKPFENEIAARAANGGAYPPDLSLMVKARFNGPDYLYALLTGYHEEAPEGFELQDGMHYNEYFPGHQIAMAQPLYEDMVDYEDGTEPTLEQHAKDLTTFLAWAASPELEERKSMGLKVMIFLIVFTAMLYALKRRIWAKVH